MWWLFLISICLMIYLLVKWLLLKMEINRVTRQLNYLRAHRFSNRVIESSTDRQCVSLINEINALLTQQKEERKKYILKEQAIREEITNVSHDFRTPLTAIKGYVQLLESEGMNREEQKETLKIINQKVDILTQYVDQFYDITLLQSRDYPVNLCYASLKQVLDEVLLSYYTQLEAHHIILQKYEVTTQHVFMDVNHTKRIFNNLMDNILKYCKSYVLIEMKVKEDAVNLYLSNDVSTKKEIEVEKLFERTYTTELNRKNGTGIGLYLVRSLMELQNGSATIEQHDALFTVSLKFNIHH